MKTSTQITERFAQENKAPEAIAGHAIELWEDGEITMTKCSNGELYGARNLHVIRFARPKSLPVRFFPNRQTNGHACVRVESVELAEELWTWAFAD